jgi:hypothetical protein
LTAATITNSEKKSARVSKLAKTLTVYYVPKIFIEYKFPHLAHASRQVSGVTRQCLNYFDASKNMLMVTCSEFDLDAFTVILLPCQAEN